jgi:hypothetical protein
LAAIVRSTSLDSDPLKADFRRFQWRVWEDLFEGDHPTQLMLDVGHRLQYGPPRDIIMGFRGLAKSYTTVAYAVWALYCDPSEIVLTLSGSDTGAKGNAYLAYAMVNSFSWLAHMKPRADQRQSAQAFDVADAPGAKNESFAAMSLFGQITGRRCTLAVPDDIETPNTSATELDRENLEKRVGEVGGAIVRPVKEGGRVKVLGTSQTERTVYLTMARDKGYGMFMVPLIYPTPQEALKYGSWLSPRIANAVEANPHLAGTSTEPTRFDAQEIHTRQLEYGSTEFDRQFRLFLDAGAGNATPIKLRDIPLVDIPAPAWDGDIRIRSLKVPSEVRWDPCPGNKVADLPVSALDGDSVMFLGSIPKDANWAAPESLVMVIDPSGTGTDETVWGILCQNLGQVGLLHMGARLEGFTEGTMKAIAKDAKHWGVGKIIIEKNFGGGMFGELLMPHLMAVQQGATIEEQNAGQVQKEIRIVDSLEPLLTGHRLWINAKVMREDFLVDYPSVEMSKRMFYRLSYQLTRITRRKKCLRHDDRLDMLATGAASFMGTLRRQLEQARRENLDVLIQAEGEKMEAAQLKAKGKLTNGALTDYLKGGIQRSLLFPGRKAL